MSTNRDVTERDFRMPEFRDAKVEDYEFRSDGKVVRKDRWKAGIHSIRNLLGFTGREFEIQDVVEGVRVLAQDRLNWNGLDENEDYPEHNAIVNVRLANGSELQNVQHIAPMGAELRSWALIGESNERLWVWSDGDPTSPIRPIAWKEAETPSSI